MMTSDNNVKITMTRKDAAIAAAVLGKTRGESFNAFAALKRAAGNPAYLAASGAIDRPLGFSLTVCDFDLPDPWDEARCDFGDLEPGERFFRSNKNTMRLQAKLGNSEYVILESDFNNSVGRTEMFPATATVYRRSVLKRHGIV